MKPLKNVAASVSQRLLNIAKQTNRPFNELVQYYALERWLYRLARSDYRNRFVLKGALMLLVWKTPVTRPTRDIDLLGRMSNDLESIRGFAADVSKTRVEFERRGMRSTRGVQLIGANVMHYMGLANHSTCAATKAALRSCSRTWLSVPKAAFASSFRLPEGLNLERLPKGALRAQ